MESGGSRKTSCLRLKVRGHKYESYRLQLDVPRPTYRLRGHARAEGCRMSCISTGRNAISQSAVPGLFCKIAIISTPWGQQSGQSHAWVGPEFDAMLCATSQQKALIPENLDS